jgi:isopenicillin-N N-acyltransferase like protein
VAVSFIEIEVSGSHREIGRQIGESARGLIAEGLAHCQEHHEAMGGPPFAVARRLALDYLAAARRTLPGVVEELEGMAEGAVVPLDALLVPNLGEEFTCNDDPGAELQPATPWSSHAGHCTSVALNVEGHVLMGHNEDWFAGEIDRNVLLRITTDDGTKILAMTSACLLPPSGINSYGIATSGNTVYANDHRGGVPNNFIRRHILEARSLADARERALVADRARGSNHLIAHVSGTLWDIETSARHDALLTSTDRLIHTNHYLSPEMAPCEISTSVGTRRRLGRAGVVLDEGLARGDEPRDVLAAILSDHDGLDEGFSICSHPDPAVPEGEREATTASMIWDLEALSVEVCAGPPCEGEHNLVRL